MIVLFTILVMPGLLIIPGWYWSNKLQPQSLWICLLPTIGLALWLVLVSLGFGAQSLSNVIEVPIIVGVAVVAAYLNFFVFVRSPTLNPYRTYLAVAIVALAAIALRALMPVLPE